MASLPLYNTVPPATSPVSDHHHHHGPSCSHGHGHSHSHQHNHSHSKKPSTISTPLLGSTTSSSIPHNISLATLSHTATHFLSNILTNKKTRNIFFYLLINLSYTFVELGYGYYINSLGLIGDGVHMFFDSSVIIMNLILSVVANWPANDKCTFGYKRVEVFAGFVNALLLVFASVSIFIGGIERLFEPPEIEGKSMFIVSVLGLIVNLCGIFLFNHGESLGHSHHHHDHDHDHHDHSHGHSHLMHGVFLHILADTLGSVAVIISSIIIYRTGWTIADPLCSMFLSLLIMGSTWSLLKESAYILLNRTPTSMEDKMIDLYRAITSVNGVTGYSNLRIWEQSADEIYATITLQLTDSNYPLSQVQTEIRALFRRAGVSQVFIEIYEKESYQFVM